MARFSILFECLTALPTLCYDIFQLYLSLKALLCDRDGTYASHLVRQRQTRGGALASRRTLAVSRVVFGLPCVVEAIYFCFTVFSWNNKTIFFLVKSL